MTVLAACAWLLAAVALAGSVYVLGFAVWGVRIGRIRERVETEDSALSFVALVPAHNEEHGIAATVESLLRADYPADLLRVIVIADNCEDATAEVARRAGAEVWERRDVERRGKGAALAWAIDRLAATPFDLVAIVDADSLVSANFFREIAAHSAWWNHAAALQARYEFAPAGGGSFDSLTIVSKAAENAFIYRPRSRSGLTLLLQGNGIVLPRAVLERVPFRANSIVEDAEYAVSLAMEGVQVRFVEGARVISRMTATVRDAAPQRLRWASGIFQLIGFAAPRLLGQAVRARSWKLVEAVAMLLMTSRALLAFVTGGACLAALLVALLHGGAGPLALAAAAVLLQFVYIVLMFRFAADRAYSLRPLLFAPVYLLFVAAVQCAALVGVRRDRWARTVR